MDAGDGVKRIGRADQPQQLAGRAGSLRALLLSRRSFSTFSAFRADTVLRSHSLNGMTSGRELRNMHGEHDSPCIFRTAGHDNQKRDLWLCKTHDAPASEKPVRHHDFPTVALYPLVQVPKFTYPAYPVACRVMRAAVLL